ncbi:hypothetical protein HpMS107_51500 [Helicobacter pylori]
MNNRPFPRPAATAGSALPVWLQKVREAQAEERRRRDGARAYFLASGGRVSARGASATRGARVGVAMSLDETNAALMDAADSDFLASRSEAAFCQAGVVAPPDSPDLGNAHDFGEGF